MSKNPDKATALAAKITAHAEDALRGLDQTMAMGRWAPEFRAIMWGAVADIAFKRKVDAEATITTSQRGTE